MELVVNTFELEPLPEPRETFEYLNDPFLKSNYKSAVNQNFINSKKPSVFKMRQRLKLRQFNSVNAIGVALKVSLFVLTLSAIF